jgi:hypothetical protein
VEIHAGMMGVVPAWDLAEFLKTNTRLIEQRERDDAYYADEARRAGRPETIIS